jgi:hypothetical protein
MKEVENHAYLIGYIVSNAFAIVLFILAATHPKFARFFFFLLFAGSGWFNWKNALQSPADYLNFSGGSLNIYSSFISGWFSENILLVIGIIASCQILIAVSMLLKSYIYKTGVIGAILFLVAIMPLGIASAFPATLIMACAMVLLLKGKHDYLWKDHAKVIGRFNKNEKPLNITSHS